MMIYDVKEILVLLFFYYMYFKFRENCHYFYLYSKIVHKMQTII